MTNPVEDAVALANTRIDAWLAELRNPERKQGQRRLKWADGSQCCLGVLCDVAGLESILPQYSPERYAYIGPVHNRPEYVSVPPQCVANSVGIDEGGNLKGGWDGVESPYVSLITLNDDHDYSFAQIAELIERNKERMIEQVRYHTERKLKT